MRPVILVLTVLLLLPGTSFAQVQRDPPPPPATGETIRPRLADSATGYIDNAIIGSEIRFRFDSSFGVNSPDRAEFFYGKCGCFRFLPPSDPAFDPNAPGPGGPGQIETKLDFQELRLDLEYVVHNRLSVLAEVPGRLIEPKTVPRAVGIADIRVGVKGGLIANDDTALTAQFRTYIPSGDARRGLGTNHTSLEPSLLFHHKLGEGVAIAGQAGIWIPIKGSAGVPTVSNEKFAGNILNYGFGLSFGLVDQPRVRISPVVEAVAWHVLGGFQTGTGVSSAKGVNILNVKIGTRIDPGGPGSFYIGFGRAVTDAVWYEDIVRMEYRLAF